MVFWCDTKTTFHPFQFGISAFVGIVVLHVEGVDALVPDTGRRVPQPVGQSPQHVDIGTALHVEHVTAFAGLDVVVGPEVLETVADILLAGQIIGLPIQQQGEIGVQRFIQNHFGMRHQYHLRIVLLRDVAQQHVDLFLPKDLQVGIGLVHQQHAAFVRVQVGKDQQHLLETAPRRRDVQRVFHPNLLVAKVDAAASVFLRQGKLHVEEALHQLGDARPVV